MPAALPTPAPPALQRLAYLVWEAPRRRGGEPAVAALTHHELLELAAPFVRQGHRLDAPASDRARRRLVFRPAPPAGDDGSVHETLQLHSPRNGHCRLVRELRQPGGLVARLLAEGPSPGDLLDSVQAVPPQRVFGAGPGWQLAWTLRVEPACHAAVSAELHAPGLTLEVRIPAVPGIAAEIELLPAPTLRRRLPDDLLAVLGWNWSSLAPCRDGYRASVRLRQAGRELEAAARHLGQTLAEPPRRFHERLRLRRYGVLLRRALPWAALGAVAAQAGWPALAAPAWLQLGLPLGLLGLYLLRSEGPRLEWPRWPRAARGAGWFEAA